MKGRQEGTIKSWNDARGFGFIAPAEGGRAVFAHISAFESGRPRMAQRVRFVAETSADGRLRASKVQLLDVALPPASERIRAATGLDRTSQLVLALLVACLAAAIGLGGLPWWIALVYGGLSGLTFLVYAADKSSARAGARRISESTLHLLALAGGWPGALVAQQVLRHKSSKTSFLAVYWATVALTARAVRCWCCRREGRGSGRGRRRCRDAFTAITGPVRGVSERVGAESIRMQWKICFDRASP